MKKKFEVSTVVTETDLKKEDGGRAIILEPETDGCFFVRLQSWDGDKNHELMNSLVGKKIKVTVEEV